MPGPVDHEKLTELFLRTLELEPAEREAFLARACAGDEDLETELRSLLSRHGRAREIFGEGALEEAIATEGEDPLPLPERIGAYRILRVLGRGGMGVVYEAEQENPRRRVALKVIPGSAVSTQSMRRFEQESRILGLLRHPGIAQVYEAGTAMTPAGREPFFAMELIRGRSLLRFLEEHRTPHRERIELLARICDAVHHAHEQGVVHRDLKPGNILVAEDGQPKILDFGIARVIDAEQAADSMGTVTGQLLGTLPYMSPEQCSRDPDAIGASSDIYSLGVILYEVLAGRPPYALNDCSLPEAVRIIQNDDPVPPSAHNPSLRGDLETILAKALEKTTHRRYPSAEDLAGDLRRHLSDQPILARPVSRSYKLRKFVRRNKALVLGAVATVAALVLGLMGTTWQAITAVRERNQVLRLSDMKRLQDLEEEARDLHPAHPERIVELTAWLGRARELADRLPLHEAALEKICSAGAFDATGSAVFSETELQWQHDALLELVTDLQWFVSSDLLRGTLHDVERRLEHASTVRVRTIEDHRVAWDEAIASIRNPQECPLYRGLVIAPQLGLVPIGRDVRSGLWEFAHSQTGEALARRQGEPQLTEAMGVVLVLIPGGCFRMGAQRRDETDTDTNADPLAQEREAPVVDVSLSPFFLAKYELTQGQWERIAHDNPSYYGPENYLPKWSEKQERHSGLLPVDDVSWLDCEYRLRTVGLELPTEAQWEYAARAGTTTPWWTGREVASLAGAANLADRFCKEQGGPAGWQYELELYDGHSVNARVGSFRANAFGLHDATGNVWEWCRDVYGDYECPPRDGDGLRIQEKGELRIFRGGGHSSVAADARSSKRDYYTPESSNFDLGVRPARQLDP